MKTLLIGFTLLTSVTSFANSSYGVRYFCSKNLPVLEENIRYAAQGETVNGAVNLLYADGAKTVICKDYVTRQDIVVATYPDEGRFALIFE